MICEIIILKNYFLFGFFLPPRFAIFDILLPINAFSVVEVVVPLAITV